MFTLFRKRLESCTSCLPASWSTSKPKTFALYNTNDRIPQLTDYLFKKETYALYATDANQKWINRLSFALRFRFFDSLELAIKYAPYCNIPDENRIFVFEMASDPLTTNYLASTGQLHLGIIAATEITRPKNAARMLNLNFDPTTFREAIKGMNSSNPNQEILDNTRIMYIGQPGRY